MLQQVIYMVTGMDLKVNSYNSTLAIAVPSL